MLTLKKVMIVVLSLFATFELSAQTKEYCSLCNMIIKDELHKATAIENGETLNFDAIECLFNYQKKKNTELKEMQVIDYNSGEYIDAKTCYYLKSKAIPSPMGAYLSAFKTEAEANKMKLDKGGEVYDYKQLKERFEKSDFGDNDQGHHHHHNRADAHAPIGVMGDHLHPKGGLMISYRHMNMFMDGNRDGSKLIDDSEVYNDYMVAPQEMGMEMHMLGLMYAPSDRLTIMIMQSYISNQMDLIARMKMDGGMNGGMNGMMGSMFMMREFSTSSEGLGDLKLSALYGLMNRENSSLHMNLKLSIPTGSISETDDTPMRNDVRLPYPMQLGSGTVDYGLGATYKKMYRKFSLGCQLNTLFRAGENSEGYRWGDIYELNSWGAYLISPSISVSARLNATHTSEMLGSDENLNPGMVSTADPNNFSGEVFNSFIGLNYAFSDDSKLSKIQLGAEAGVPLYQNYSGVHMNSQYTINLGLKYNLL